MFKLPRKMFPHSIQYIEKAEDTNWSAGEVVVDEIVTGVRISSNVSRDNSTESFSDESKAVLYVIPESSRTDFKKGAEVVYNGQKYIIKTVHLFTQPYSSAPHHWKVELI